MSTPAWIPSRPQGLPATPRVRRRTVRFQLTALYGALFVMTGAALLAITYGLVAARNRNVLIKGHCREAINLLPCPSLRTSAVAAALNRNREAWQHYLLQQSVIALAIMTAVSIGLGWLVAGQVLRPLRRITAAAQNLSTENLHERIAMQGPNDELKYLADTFDGMLTRLDTAFDSQRQFIANASHQLHTPLTVQRAAIDVALADPHPTISSLRTMAIQIRAATERNEHIIASLLALARGQRGVQRWDRVDLAAVADDSIEAVSSYATSAEVTPAFTRHLTPAPMLGDRTLLDQLAANLIGNACQHNVPGGWVTVHAGLRSGAAELRIANSGPVIPPEAAQSLFEPFRQLGSDRAQNGTAQGAGLGLSIVAAITAAHRGTLIARPLPSGGLEVTVTLPQGLDQGFGRRGSYRPRGRAITAVIAPSPPGSIS